jgi:membrane peptidoglycan carboxypeptidase
MVPPHTPLAVTGGAYPAQIWQRFMSAAIAGMPLIPFQAPTTTTTPPRSSGAPPPPASVVGPPQPVPAVVGVPTDRARQILQEAGFVVKTVPSAKGAKPPGVVMVQSPRGGSSAPRGSTVALEASEPKGKDAG